MFLMTATNDTMTATDAQFAQIKTGPETALYLRRYNCACKKVAKGERTRQPSTAECVREMESLNPGTSLELLASFRQSLRGEIQANHK